MRFSRYAIYYTPEKSPLAAFGASWLGWDALEGRLVPHPEVRGLPKPVAELTRTPRKYGFHGTLKPPFRLAASTDEAGLRASVAALAAQMAPVVLQGLELAHLGSFLALTPQGDAAALAALAGRVVQELDPFRAPPGEEELTRRRQSGLSARQEELLLRWGYPYVLDQFRFHLTLTGRLEPAELAAVEAALRPVITPLLPSPYVIGDLTLLGEDKAGHFHQIARYALTG